jgi:hypothetical protein
VRFRQASRRGTASWWGITLCALVFAGTYVVFDILDVDGSRMSRGPALDGTLTATLEASGERFFRTPAVVTGSTDLLRLSLSRLSPSVPRRNSSAGTLLHQRWSHVFPRVTLAAGRARGSSPNADPL